MKDHIDRREAIRRLALLSTAALTPAWLYACKSKPSCSDVTGLTTDEVNMRNTIAGYVERSPDPMKLCSNCAQYVAPPSADACAGCKVVKGPILPQGYCKLWVATTN